MMWSNVARLKPGASAISRYSSGDSDGKSKLPSALVVEDRDSLVFTRTKVSLTLGKTAPEASLTTPEPLPEGAAQATPAERLSTMAARVKPRHVLEPLRERREEDRVESMGLLRR